ncbi:hypothetical protein [Hymenobacter sp. BRD67]|uniref:hypothetical protein n=1 Tax=Hymenobacter sp. BRD67 TaxID=2675877 RepID=UPI0015637AFC|nr:hypothetical protein [Hymenobacter sp. BRD67]QKG51589.1 hypothetical protein GKZ67_02020 [Hymenobacter sp. BRD67]
MLHTLHDIPVCPDCRHFRGDLPCRPNKEHGYLCGDCPVYAPVSKRILLIKLGLLAMSFGLRRFCGGYGKNIPAAILPGLRLRRLFCRSRKSRRF